MTKTPSGKRKARKKLVPVDGAKIRAIMDARGMTVYELAQRTGERNETMSLIVSGTTKRCDRRRLQRISRVIGCTDLDFLTGDSERLKCAGFHQKRDVLGKPIREADGRLVFEEDPAAPTRQQLAQSEFLRPCLETLEQDYQPQHDADNEWRMVHLLLALLIDPKSWRRRLTYKGQPMSEEDQTEVTEALSRAFKIILRPWFSSQATEGLDVKKLGMVIGVEGEALEQIERVEERITAINNDSWVPPKAEEPDASKAPTKKRKPR